MARCTARSKRSGRQCGKDAMKAKAVCHMHGGKSKAGFASPTFKTGRRSRHVGALSPLLGEIYLARKRDPKQLSLTPDIALLDTRVELLLKRMQEGESPTGWRSGLEAFEEFAEAQAKKDKEAAVAALRKLSGILRHGVEAERAWDKIEDLAWARRPRLVEVEMKRQVALAELVHLSTVLQLFEVLAEAVKRYVKNPETMNAIADDIRRIGGTFFVRAGDQDNEDDEDGSVH